MTILLTSDDSVAENAVHVCGEIDDEVLAALQSSDFDIIVDPINGTSRLRMAPALVNRICEWVSLRSCQSLARPAERCQKDRMLGTISLAHAGHVRSTRQSLRKYPAGS